MKKQDKANMKNNTSLAIFETHNYLRPNDLRCRLVKISAKKRKTQSIKLVEKSPI